MQDEAAKRLRPAADSSVPAASVAPNVWPSASTLYARGLENRAEAVGIEDKSWAINGVEWRAAGFDAADVGGAELKRRQAEARRAMLALQRPPS